MADEIATRGRAATENEEGCKPRADVLMSKAVPGDTMYLIRLREDWYTRTSYHVKKMADFISLDEKLKIDKEKMGEAHALSLVPDLPAAGSRFGIRRQLSKLGASGFLDRQSEGLQAYLETLMSQIPNLAADANLQFFFSEEATTPQDQELCKNLVMEIKAGKNLAAIKGYWKIAGSDRIWNVDENGKALLDGKHRGVEYDLTEHGQSLDLTIDRKDGWAIDIDKSSKERLVWYLVGNDDLEWFREADAAAEAALKKLAAAAAS